MRNFLSSVVASLAFSPDIDARQMAAAPLVTPPAAEPAKADKTEKKAKANRFASFFGAVSFKAEPVRAPFVFPTGAEAGTKQTGLASVLIEARGIPGFYVSSARIVKRESADGQRIEIRLSMPTVQQGPVRRPVFNANDADEATQAEYLAWQRGVIAEYKSWRKGNIKNGVTSAVAVAPGSSALSLTAEELAELGL